ncbi:cystathionine gamma-lyase [Streptomyces radicis]|uniref:Cystathionine gamma-lyase n=1 Tax=Streptomyces radicis TaxID=1750517 RepID=A0A3A9WEY0_9ACTN|nr:cystathionine gamma-lyase [Streptomyces radicis]RKN11330.1 cystathionine gamma-lyase [Streptomyces radicis]RKN26647.1 cystathionine gamma-lyase [Streptomyces radicis]
MIGHNGAEIDGVGGLGGLDGVGEGTRAVRAGLPDAEPYRPPMPGPVLAAHYHLPGDPAAAPYGYGREANPTWTLLERAVADLESPTAPAHATVFPSGIAATAAVLFALLRPGDTAVLPSDGYQLLPRVRARLEAFGVTFRTAPTGGDAQLAALDGGVRLLWLETPSNPGLDVCDIRRLCAAAHAGGALVAVDNTLATPLGQRPLDLGADLSVASGTKAFNGHGDVLLGYVATRDDRLADEIRAWRTTTGAILGPMEAWLAHRGLATLHLRTDRQQANALAVAAALRERPEVTGLRYPGLPDDPAHATAAAQMRRYGCVVSFTLPDRERAERFLAALSLVGDATSFGGVRSTAERRARWGGDPVAEGFIRLSVGVEDADDLIADLCAALDTASEARP